MKITFTTLFCLFCIALFSQQIAEPPKTKIMTLGVFHFQFPNLDFQKTDKKDEISVLDEPFQSQIVALCRWIEEFKPTKIAVEFNPIHQLRVDSLFNLYKSGRWQLGKNEVYQLGFRMAKNLGHGRVYCIDDMGRHYSRIDSLFKDNQRLKRFENYYMSNADSIYRQVQKQEKIGDIAQTIKELNNPHNIKERLAAYLLHPFKYEEVPGDFTGVDFESGRWYNRNLRIFRNIQRINQDRDERILLIIGSDHLNLLNHLFDVSKEFELVSPLQYIK